MATAGGSVMLTAHERRCLNALIALAQNGRMQANELTEIMMLSRTGVEAYMRPLRDAGIVKTFQGRRGGFALVMQPERVTLCAIVNALRGSRYGVSIPDQAEAVLNDKLGRISVRDLL